VQDRGLAAYIAELVGTFFLVFIVGTVVTLYVAGGGQSQFGSDFAVIGLVHGFALFALVQIFAGVSGAHFNPAVTLGATLLKRIDPVDAIVYVLAQLSGGVLGALLVKGLLSDEGEAGNYGAVQVSDLLAGDFAGMIV
jgi:aquaporin Z